MASNTNYHKLEEFGFSENAIAAYVGLLEFGTLSVLELSRKSKVSRGKIYRGIEDLKELGMVKEVVGQHGSLFEAEPYEKLELHVQRKQDEVRGLKQTLPVLFKDLAAIESENEFKDSKVLHYRGLEGLKQVTWNSLKTKGDFRIWEIKDMSAFLDFGFAEKLRKEFVKRNIFVKELTNQESVKDWTNETEFVEKHSEIRHIPKDVLEVKFEILIYNDVYVMYTYRDGDIFCVEVYNPELAAMQKQMFDYFWGIAKKMEYVSQKGAARVVRK